MKKWKYNYVYIITNLLNGQQYVGDHSTNNLDDGYLGGGILITRARKKYGRENFKKEILEFFETKQEAFDAQKGWINEYNTVRPNGYNISPAGGTQCHGGYSNEIREKISGSVKKKIRENPDYRRKISEANLGKKQSSEAIEKRVSKFRGIPRSGETKKKIGNANRGIKHSTQSRENMSEAHKGQKAWNKGITQSEETKRKLRECNLGKKQSSETIEKIKNTWAKKMEKLS